MHKSVYFLAGLGGIGTDGTRRLRKVPLGADRTFPKAQLWLLALRAMGRIYRGLCTPHFWPTRTQKYWGVASACRHLRTQPCPGSSP